MLLSVMLLVTLKFVWFETLNVATSEGPFGTVAGFQLAGVFQLPVAGACSQVALPAKARPALPKSRKTIAAFRRRENDQKRIMYRHSFPSVARANEER